MNLYLPIEVKTRELTAKTLIASRFVNLNYRAYIGSKFSINSFVLNKKQKEGIYLYSGGLDLKSLTAIKNKCEYFVILDEEYGPAISNWNNIGDRISLKTLGMIDGLFVLGEYAKNAAIKQYPDLKNKIHKTGWPRVDLWNDKYRPMYLDKVNQILKIHGDFILFSSDFGLLTEERVLKSKEFLLSSHDYEKTVNSANKQTDTARIVMDEFKNLVKILRKIDAFLNTKIIIRPHPVEEINVWIDMLKGLKNIYVVYEGDSTEWIQASNGVIHRGCTSAVHAYYSKLKVGYLNLSRNSLDRSNGLPFKLSEQIMSEDELLEFCNRESQTRKLSKAHLHFYDKTIYSEKDKESCKLISNFLHENFKTNNPDLDIKVSKLLPFKVFIKTHYSFLKSKLRLFLYPNSYATTPISRKIPGGIKLSEVRRLISFFSENDNISSERVMKNLIKIENNK